MSQFYNCDQSIYYAFPNYYFPVLILWLLTFSTLHHHVSILDKKFQINSAISEFVHHFIIIWIKTNATMIKIPTQREQNIHINTTHRRDVRTALPKRWSNRTTPIKIHGIDKRRKDSKASGHVLLFPMFYKRCKVR